MTVAVIGAGIMGSGIAQLAVMSGYDTALCDIGAAELERASQAIDRSLARFVKAERLTQDAAKVACDRLRLTTSLEDATGGAGVVIEAVPEILELKREVLSAAAAVAPEDALLGTNTSQLSITQIGAPLGDAAERLIGTHFFNPPVMMRLVELVCGLATTLDTLERARQFSIELGKEVVVCRKDSPGFITSRAYAAFRLECLRILEEGVASAEDIDKALKLAFNLPMGPLELSDFNGIDTYLHAVTALHEAYGERFKPTVGLRNMVASGRLGRKTGAGFYQYDDNGKADVGLSTEGRGPDGTSA